MVHVRAVCAAAALATAACTDEPLGAAAASSVGEIQGAPVSYTGEATCFELHVTRADADVTWIWGDGARDVVPARARACHAYEEPGSVLVGAVVQVDGTTVNRTLPIVVVPRPLAPPPTGSSPIAYDSHRDLVWVANEDAGTVTVIDAVELESVGEIAVGSRPRTVAVGRDVVAVACQGDDAVWLLSASSLAPVQALHLGVGAAPYGVAADPRGHGFWVSLFGSGEVAALDVQGAEGRIGARLFVGVEPRGIAVHPDGRVMATRWRAETAAGSAVYVLDGSDRAAPRRSFEVALPPDVRGDTDTDNDGVPSFSNQIAISPSGLEAVVPSLKANVIGGEWNNGRRLRPDTTARGILSRLVLEGPERAPREVAEGRHPFDDLDFASGAAFSPEGARLFVSFLGARRLRVLDAFSLDVAGSIDDVGEAPNGLAVSPDGSRLFVHASLSRAVLVFDTGGGGAELPLLARIATVEREPLAPVVLRGKRVFHASRDPRMSKTNYLSCASCHLDAESDGLVWDFTQRGEGLRATIPLAGRAGTAHGPMHWSANFDEVQDFEHDIRGGQGGTGFTRDEDFAGATPLGDPKAGLSDDLDALAAYLSSLSSFGRSPSRRDDDPAWRAARSRGEALFRSPATGCAECHAGPRYTDSGFGPRGTPIVHDVGTLAPSSGSRLGGALTGLDTPTLRGLWKSAPYLHDGSAPSLSDVLVTRNAGDRHGRTGHLGEEELADLVTFLSALDDDAP